MVNFGVKLNYFSVLLTIGKFELKEKPLLLAPMEDLTDPSFRYICKEYGADLMYTEFISSDGLIRHGEKSLKKLRITEQERPIGIQLYGHLVEAMVEAAKMAEKSQDLHKGSPVILEGKLTFETWQTDEGQNRSKLSITGFKIHKLAKEEQNTLTRDEVDNYATSPQPENNITDDDVPF